MRLDVPGVDAVDEVLDLWVDLARGQRAFGSHLLATSNRRVVREALTRHAVTDGLVVARDGDDAIVGFVMFGPESGSYEQDVDRGIVENIYVVPDRRGEGVGSALLAAAEERLDDAGVDTVALEAMADNEAARRFYRRHGYDPHRVELEKDAGESRSDTHTNT